MRAPALLCLFGVLSTGEAQEIPTIRVPVRVVTVPALVFSKDDRILLDLAAGDFQVFDNGRRRRVTLDSTVSPVSVVFAVQVNWDVREYVPFIAGAGAVFEAHLVGETGEAALVTYNDDVKVTTTFESSNVVEAFHKISAGGKDARMIDAGMRAIGLLATRPRTRARVLVFVGQASDRGSESTIEVLRQEAERQNVAVHSLTLPEAGKAFISDTFSIQPLSREERGGFRAGVDLRRLVSVLNRSTRAAVGADSASKLVADSGGTQINLRTRKELEDAIGAIGVTLRSAHVLSYPVDAAEVGRHNLRVHVNRPGAKVFARPGYWMIAD